MEHKNIISRDFWEGMLGQSRAVRVGNYIEVSATNCLNEKGEIEGGKNVFQQAFYIVQKIEKALQAEEAELSDVVRLRIYMVDISDWEEVAKVIHHFFAEIKPAATMIEVSALIDKKFLIEIEATAIK